MTRVGQQGESSVGSERLAWSVFAFAWCWVLLADRVKRHAVDWDQLDWSNLLVVCCAVGVVLWPRALPLFALCASAQVVGWLADSSTQIIWYLSGLTHLAALLACLHWGVAPRGRSPYAGLWHGMGGPGRWLMVAGMGAAGFAKLNHDFLEPRLSCGAVYYLWLAESPLLGWLPTSPAAQHGAILFAVVAELGGPLLMLWSRTRWVGLGLLVGVWFGLSANPRAHYFEFAGLFWALTIFWIPAAVWGRGAAVLRARVDALRDRCPAPLRALASPWSARAVLAVFLGLVVFGGALSLDKGARLEWLRYGTLVLFAVLSGCAWLGRRAWRGWPRTGRPVAWLAWAVLPVLLVNETLPYVGLPHRPSFTMAANLRLSPLRSNHVLVDPVPHPPFGGLVLVVESNMRGLRRGVQMPWLSFVEYMSKHPKAEVWYRHPRERRQLARGDDPRFEGGSFWARHLHLHRYWRRASRVACDKAPPGLSRAAGRREVRARKRALRASR